jgi:hypothetical protein
MSLIKIKVWLDYMDSDKDSKLLDSVKMAQHLLEGLVQVELNSMEQKVPLKVAIMKVVRQE